MAIERNQLKTVLLDALERVQNIDLTPRNIQIEQQMPTIFVGVRRCGKSFLLYQRMHELAAKGHRWEEFLYVNFEDERLIGFTHLDFNLLLETHHELHQTTPILFLDEIQNIKGWEQFARRLADEKRKVYITGSNASMLSREMASSLGGRYLVQSVYPYSFEEFLLANGLIPQNKHLFSTTGRGDLMRLFEQYFYYGGFPELTNITLKREYLSSIYDKIYLGDIGMRYGISNYKALEIMMKKLAETLRHPLSYTRLTNIVSAANISVGKSTIIQYLQYAEESQLIFSLDNYASTLVEKTTTPKYYFIDNGLLNLFLIQSEAALLENLVALALIRAYGRKNAVFYYEKNIEVDFFLPEESMAIQACYSLKDHQTYEREVQALQKLHAFRPYKKACIITYDEEATIEEKGLRIDVLPAAKWLLSLV